MEGRDKTNGRTQGISTERSRQANNNNNKIGTQKGG